MKEQTDLVLFYILPYTKRYSDGHHYYNDEISCMDYKSSNITIWKGESLFFDDKDQLLNWFYANTDKPIPSVYRIKYLENYKGLDDVIELTNLSSNVTTYHTILNKKTCAYYDVKKSESCGKDVWVPYPLDKTAETFDIRDMYDEFTKRGIKLKCDVFKKNIDKVNCFEFIGDPFHIVDAYKMQTKKLILYKENKIRLNRYEKEAFLKQILPAEEVERILQEEIELIFQEESEQNGPVLTKKNTPQKPHQKV